MILLKLELQPVSLANKLLFWMVLRAVLLAGVFISVFLAPVILTIAVLVFYGLSSIGYYFAVHRLALAVFTLACGGGEARRASPAAVSAPEA